MHRSQLIRVLLGRRAGGRATPAIIQLAMIFVWHIALNLMARLLPLGKLTELASAFWFKIGITKTVITGVRYATTDEIGVSDYLWMVAAASSIYFLLEAIIGWFGYRLFVQRPAPKWYRFIRFWWRACIYGTPVYFAVMIITAVLPGSPANPAGFFIVLVLFVSYFFLVPGLLGSREIRRRQRRIEKLCPKCGYWLRSITSPSCPECGAAVEVTA